MDGWTTDEALASDFLSTESNGAKWKITCKSDGVDGINLPSLGFILVGLSERSSYRKIAGVTLTLGRHGSAVGFR